MTKYELPEELMARYFNDTRKIARVAALVTAEELTKDLISAFEIKRAYWYAMRDDGKVAGIDDCIDHLKAFLKT
jgi:hypothetical protein